MGVLRFGQVATSMFVLLPVLISAGKPPYKPAEFLAQPVPTQFDVAMLDTIKAVREGREPDPASRRIDGTPGTLLDALLPERLLEGEKEQHRRQLGQDASKWRFFGANIPFLQGPTLAALNASFYRYSSVAINVTYGVDWRKTIYITPIQTQWDCASCWVMAAADAVAMAYGIATKVPSIPAGVQQICDCGGVTCCQGGWPEDAFAWLVTQGNITTAANYQYWAQDGRTCRLSPGYPIAGAVTGWERVPIFSQDDLLRAVSMQPVLVYISASSKDFQNYTSDSPGKQNFRIYDGNCSTEVNHAVLVVGYSLSGSCSSAYAGSGGSTSTPCYWILKNTWPSFGWGDNGYMYIAMYDGPGKCGMLSVNPIFPVYFPNAPVDATVDGDSYPVTMYASYWWTWWVAVNNPCTGIINPCGQGLCYQLNGIARCSCPSPYVELVAAPTSKCLNPNPCTSSLVSPCAAGTCMNVGDGSYICGCPSGYTVGVRVNGAPTCIPVSALNLGSAKPVTYVAQYGDTCSSIASAFAMTSSQITALNPYLKCNKRLAQGITVNVLSGAASSYCIQQYAVRPGDLCGEIAYYMDIYGSSFYNWLKPTTWTSSTKPSEQPTLLYSVPALNYNNWYNPASFMALNPGINCSTLMSSQLVCVQGSTSLSTVTPVVCGQTYTTQYGDSCSSVANQFRMNSTFFSRLNPGINCYYNGGAFFAGVQLCVSLNSSIQVNCTQWYTVQQGDSCAQIWNAANVSQYQLLYINPGLQCQPPYLYVGLQICIDSPLLDKISDPNYLLYTVQAGDTWPIVQSQFAKRCKADSISIGAMASQNNFSDWSSTCSGANCSNWQSLPTGAILVIPCVPKIGATCGCVASLTVCGANNFNYDSYCDARCNFATTTSMTMGPCSGCQLACYGRFGLTPSPASACAANTVCAWPQWSPPLTDATAVYTTAPLCSYRQQTCTRGCTQYNTANGLASTDANCYNNCYACHRAPCSGTPVLIPVGSSPCSTCTSGGCAAYSKDYCVTTCSYWNSIWGALNV